MVTTDGGAVMIALDVMVVAAGTKVVLDANFVNNGIFNIREGYRRVPGYMGDLIISRPISGSTWI